MKIPTRASVLPKELRGDDQGWLEDGGGRELTSGEVAAELLRRAKRFPIDKTKPRQISRTEAADVFKVPDEAVTKAALQTPYNPADILTPEQLAERLQVDLGWLREKRRNRDHSRIPVIKLGRYNRYYWPDVCRWLQEKSKRG